MLIKNGFAKVFLGALCISCAGLLLISHTSTKDSAPEKPSKEEVSKASQAFGQLVGRELLSKDINLDVREVIKGIQQATKGDKNVLSEEECIKVYSEAYIKALKYQAATNLKSANAFLLANSKKPHIISIAEGKIQYEVLKEGTGVTIEPHHSPLVRLQGKFIDGSPFGKPQEPEVLALDETISGIAKGIVGMKEGEKRVIYIHPDLAYGTQASIPPNSLLTIEVEVLKADGLADNNLPKHIKEQRKLKYNPEIAFPGDSESFPR